MLSQADSRVVQAGSCIPGLAILLDPEALLALMRERLPAFDLKEVLILYVRYKPGTNCLAALQLRTGSETVSAYAKAFCRKDAPKLRKAVLEPATPGPLGPGRQVFEEIGLLVSVFPNDRQLPILPQLADENTRPILLKRLMPGRPDLWAAELHTLAYKPNRRYVGQLVGKGLPLAVIKAYLESDFQRTNRRAKVLKSGSVLKVTHRLGRSRRKSMLALEWMPGRLLREVLCDSHFCEGAVARVGEALLELHSQSPHKLDKRKRRAEGKYLMGMARAIESLYPQQAACADRLARRLAEGLAERYVKGSPIHADLHTRQVLLGEDNTIILLDLDEARRGEPERDLGNFIAHLHRDVFSGRLPQERLAPTREALLQGYSEAGGRIGETGLNFYTSLGLFHLLIHPFRDREANWPETLEQILDLAQTLYATARMRRL